MALTWEKFVGRTDTFAVRFSLRADPDSGLGATPEESASWGSFELWVDGRNLCSNVDQGEVLSGAHWYLLPLAEWLVSNWNPLLHEERLPIRNSADTGVGGLASTRIVPSLASETDIVHWEEEWFEWRNRHAFRAARSGGLFPNVVVRRLRDYIEVSWQDESEAGESSGFGFLAAGGSVLLEPSDVATPLFEAVEALIGHLHHQYPCSERLGQLARDCAQLGLPQQVDERTPWLAGAVTASGDPGPLTSSVDSSWTLLKEVLGVGDSAAAALTITESPLCVTGSSEAALVFSSVAPTISADDVRTLASVLNDQYAVDAEDVAVDRLVRAVPVDVSTESWEQGYDLAEALHGELESTFEEGWVDIESIVRDLGIAVLARKLDDQDVRACSLVGPRLRPTVVHNSSSRYQASHARRFTLAHELCHLLYDRAHGTRVAIASGPWAPRAIERRANAFAAMFLMPVDLVEELVADAPDPIDTPEAIAALASRLRVSRSAVIEHLYNLTLMPESVRDRLIRQGQRTDA